MCVARFATGARSPPRHSSRVRPGTSGGPVFATGPSATVLGVEGRSVTVEVHVSSGLPGFTVVGLPDASVREARDRVRAALLSSKLPWPLRRVTVNLAPSGIRKVGSGLDLAIAVGLMVASGEVEPAAVNGVGFIGELGLDGSVRPVAGTVPLVDALASEVAVVPAPSAHEARLVGRHRVRPVGHLVEVFGALKGEAPWPDPPEPPAPPSPPPPPDLADVRGQPAARRALEVAAAGGHHLLLSGPPGGGKTMLATRLAGLLPPLAPEMAALATRVHSAAGVALPPGGMVVDPPFRAPHHSSTMVALVGGGTATMRPGELSLATGGVLFLDELGEFSPSVLDALRQPLEDGIVRVARARASVDLPARFLLVAATNPCPCGWAGEPARCRCSEASRHRYRRRLSGPLLDRFDLRVEVARPAVGDLLGGEGGEPSAAVAARVAAARARARQRGVEHNSAIPAADLVALAPLDASAVRVLEASLQQGRLTARGMGRVRRVALTLADLEGHEGALTAEHVALALGLRAEPVLQDAAA
ncbi:MAG: YifB family Mg chelatase-like AAA ATPase [Actinobacteria bacterium]|nr:YifB family Mg chelatase-like AAA ATPase [Actinomycetota bacterium]